MVFLGFLLVAVAIAATVGVVLDNTEPTDLVVFGQTVPGVHEQWQVFLVGAGTAVVLVAGVALTFMGAARRARTRRDLRELREEHEESLTTLEMEKRRLQRELARVRKAASRPEPTVSAQPAPPARPSGNRRQQRREAAAPTAQGTRVAPRSQVSATSPFFDRAD
ncbi:hypothetical protein GCM10022254_55930 [Actinomadura meridiana]|uniref:Lipopolysaccharide assembly protein A domain-containing protein n=1 Tax=Actinomadura meridiana TaxID=559626 RepID=A0ABP8CGI0_9ACTN